MPRVDLYRDKYIDSDAVQFIEGKTKQEGKQDKDIMRNLKKNHHYHHHHLYYVPDTMLGSMLTTS